ncbi:hypothetical protein [Streptomyces sp. NPDC058382]|uniref:hypothetical protein n=1 Tax=unclassified Streptomyces TaxID=2593676 RepID=UPI0036449583
MPISTPRRPGPVAMALLLVSAVASLTACGEQHVAAGAPSASPSAGPGTAGPGASPYVEPGSHDGAPHYNDNNAGRRPSAISRAGEKDARREADRIEPVLERLWKQGKWDPRSVRSAMLALGYREQAGSEGERPSGRLEVRAMQPRFETDHYVTPAGARIGLRVRRDACVTAFTQKTNYQVQVNGPYPETGCFAPPFAH